MKLLSAVVRCLSCIKFVSSSARRRLVQLLPVTAVTAAYLAPLASFVRRLNTMTLKYSFTERIMYL